MVSPTVDQLVRDSFDTGNKGVMWFMIVHSAPQFLLLGVLVGLLSDVFKRRLPLIALGLVGTGVTTMLLPWIRSYPLLLSVRFLDGLFGIAAIGLLMARVVDLCPPGGRARGMGVLMASIPAGYLSGMVLSGLLGDTGLHLLFGVCGGALVLGGILLTRRFSMEAPVEASAAPVLDFRATVRELPRMWVPLLFGFVDKVTFAAIAMLTSLVIVDRFGLKEVRWASIALAAYWLGFIAFSRLSAKLTSSIGLVRTVLAGSTAYGIVLIALPNGNYTFFVTLMALAGLLTALQVVPTMALVGELSSPQRRAANMGAFNLAGSMGIMLGFALAGTLTSAASYVVAFAVVGALEIVCASVAAVFFRVLKTQRDSPVESRVDQDRLYSQMGGIAPTEVSQ